ncbi:MAG: T9SS type A sorting domain-containing protein, partial [Paludibacteraceae bacterium]|nr:T9SS type A sorting domain-containing protein [Paludibacteraceae bacterium]
QFVITGLPQAGVYMVNITTATGSRYHGKVIVK